MKNTCNSDDYPCFSSVGGELHVFIFLMLVHFFGCRMLVRQVDPLSWVMTVYSHVISRY